MNTCNQLLIYCQKILPLVYDNSLSYYENLCRLAEIINKTINELNKISDELDSLNENILEIVTNIVNEALQNGQIFLNTQYDSETKTLTFIFNKIESEE